MSLPTYKVIVIGDTNTGKTSIIHQYTRNNFPEAHFTTPLPIEHSKNVNGKCNLDIWDTAGAEEWQSMNSSVYHGSDAVIYLCSYDNAKSLSDIRDVWKSKIGDHINANVPTFLAVNKDDLEDDQKIIENDEIESMKNEIGARDFISVSAKTNTRVEDLFKMVAEELIKVHPASQSAPAPVPKTETEKSKGCSC